MQRYTIRCRFPPICSRRMVTRRAFLRLLTFLSFVSFLLFISLSQKLARQQENGIMPSAQNTTINGTSNSTSIPLPRILIVSSLFPLAKSKHSMDSYRLWLSVFLGAISTDVYFFTTPELAPLVHRVRGDLPITVNTSFASPFDVPPLQGLQEHYNAMHRLDPENFRHSPELYAVWNAKPYFLDTAVTHCGKEYDFAFWNDGGGFRFEHVYTQWPDPARVRDIWEEGSRVSRTKQEDLVFFPLSGVPSWRKKFWTENMGPLDDDVSQGSFFGGSPQAISWWKHTFYIYHNHYLSLGIFVGKDQSLINALFLLFPSRFITVWRDDPLAPARLGLLPPIDSGLLGNCIGFYHQWWMANEETREKMRAIFDKNKGWTTWWQKRQQCRMTRVLSMTRVLAREFGVGWKVPGRSRFI